MLKRMDEELDRWETEQDFEQDVRMMLSILRPHRNQRLLGWSEYQTRDPHFRVTVSWDREFEREDSGQAAEAERWAVPRIAEVLENVLVGSVKNQDELTAQEEFEMYRAVVTDLYRRIDELRRRCE